MCLRASRRDARKLVWVWGWGRPRGVVVLFGATILVRSAYAEDGAPLASEESVVEVTEVVVRGTPSTDADLRNSVVISGRDIVQQNAASVVDAVREKPGVSIQQTTPGQGTIHVRGFSGRAVGHTIDGVAPGPPCRPKSAETGRPVFGGLSSKGVDSLRRRQFLRVRAGFSLDDRSRIPLHGTPE